MTDPSGHIAIPAFDPGNGGNGKKLVNFGWDGSAYPTQDELVDLFSLGYNPFKDPDYAAASPSDSLPDQKDMFDTYYQWAYANDAWLPLPDDMRHDIFAYWECVGLGTVSRRSSFQRGVGITASSPGVWVGLTETGIQTFRGWGGIWTPGTPGDPVKNAYRHWVEHRSDFPHLNNAKEYVEAAHRFLNNPPSTALTKTRPNGELVVYDPVSDIFGVRTSAGVPKTMFIPDPSVHGYPTNLDYFNAQ